MPDVGTGTLVAFATSGFTGDLLSVGHSGISREAIDISDLNDVNWRSFIPGDLADPGELTLEILFDPDDTPPWNDVAEQITVTFPLPAGQMTPATWVANGFLTSWENNAPLEDRMLATATFKLSGAIVVTPSA